MDAISLDLRLRILCACDLAEQTREETAEAFAVSRLVTRDDVRLHPVQPRPVRRQSSHRPIAARAFGSCPGRSPSQPRSCGGDRFCMVKARTAIETNRQDIARRLAAFVQGRVQ